MSFASWIDEEAYLHLVRGETRGPVATFQRMALSLAARGYGVGVALRNRRYDRGSTPIHRVSVPVVSIGNITLGGTGKTPMVEWAANWFRGRGTRVAILSRGYGREGHGSVNDEGMVLEENLPDVPHLQDPDRFKSATIAVEELESQVLLLDDGFQHRRLGRDLDVVLLDALEPFGLGRMFPRGLLREPPRALQRAGVVVLSRADLVSSERRRAIRREAERAAGPLRWVEAQQAPTGLSAGGTGLEPLDGLKGRRIAAFCGIGNPDGFVRTITPLCGEVVDFRRFPDHHPYTAADVDALIRWVRDLGADLALTTQKDLVKLRLDRLGNVPLRALRIGVELMDSADLLEDALGAIQARIGH